MSSPNIEDTIPARPDPSTPSTAQPAPEQAPAKKVRKLFIIIAGIVLILAFTAVGGWMGYQSGQNAKDQNQLSQRAVDAATQLRGQAGANQIPNVKTALIQSLGGPASTAVSHILQKLD